MNKRVAVILCGSGFKDGSEIRESVGVLWALSSHPVNVQCFAPNHEQVDVVNCLTGQPTPGERRNMLVEAARIARGDVRPLTKFEPKECDAMIIPGGFGAAKNLCTFAFKGSQGTVLDELARPLDELLQVGKPIGAVCIAPAILALAFKGRSLELTLGAESEAAREIERLGHKHVVRGASECHVDERHRVVTTPAYMCDSAPLHEIFEGIRKLVDEVVRLARDPVAY